MLLDPLVAPAVRVTPVIGVHVHGAEIDGGELEDFLEIDAFVAGVGVGLFVAGDVGGGGCEPAFVA